MRGRSRLRAAVGLSVGLHLALAAGLVCVARWRADRPDEPAPRPGVETRVDVTVRLFEPETDAPVAVSEPPPTTVEGPVDPPPLAQTEPPPPADPPRQKPPVSEPDAAGSRPLLARAVPRPLPPELLALMRRPPAPAVTEVPLDLPAVGRATPDPGPVRPAAATAPAKSAPLPLDGGSPVHGALTSGQTVVYVLDASGSMGEWGKYDLARRALAATLRQQPATVRFQVVVYAAAAFLPLRAPETRCVPATADNVNRMAAALLALAHPAGRSDHAAGLRAALELRPDVVVFVTDADGPPPAAFRELVRRADPRPVVCVARVGAGAVAPPAEWK
ncbi:MAG: VWA domain-containing protein [Gemmataceae bacterium]|nr:VWA domain-containing protein [Gemmataceae bacterium]